MTEEDGWSFVTVSFVTAFLLLFWIHGAERDGYDWDVKYDCDYYYNNWDTVSKEWYDECVSELEQSRQEGLRLWNMCCIIFWIIPTLFVTWQINSETETSEILFPK